MTWWTWDPLLPGGTIQQGGAAALVSIAVTPSPATASVGGTQQFTATGTYDDLSTADVTATSTWSTSAAATATVGAATGLATGVAQGYATITATIGAISGGAVLGVVSAHAAAGQYQWVLAIEGYPWLLTDGDPQAVAAAWAGTDWATTWQYRGGESVVSARVLGGLSVQLDHDQKLHPYQPFVSGPSLTFLVSPDPLSSNPDQFGEDLAKRQTSPRVYMTRTADRDDTTIAVENTTDFDTPAGSAPLAFVGTEAFTYTAKATNAFTGVSRGIYSPFRSYANSTRFAQHHRVGTVSYSSKLAPLVTREMRTWKGRWVGLWLHTKLAGTLDLKADARLVYAGKIVDYSDSDDGRTVVDCEHVLDVLSKTSLLRDTYRASLREGVYLAPDDEFNFRDHNTTDGWKPATALRIEATASGTHQLAAGYYTFDSLCAYLGSWLAGEKAAARIKGTYSFGRIATTSGPRLVIYWEIASTANTRVKWRIQMPETVALFLGLYPVGSPGSDGWWTSDDVDGDSRTPTQFTSPEEPYSTIINRFQGNGVRLSLEDTDGVLVDQTAFLPTALSMFPSEYPTSPGVPSVNWGIFLLDERVAVIGRYTTTSRAATNELEYVTILPEKFALGTGELRHGVWNREGHLLSDQTQMSIRQVLVLEDTAANLMLATIYSSGVSGYNHPTYDVLGAGGGAAIPYGLLGTTFDAEVQNMPGADLPEMVVLDKSTTFGDLWKSSLLVRRAHIVWTGSGRLRLAHWRTPVSGSSVAALTEANKAEPYGNKAGQRSVMRMSSTWAKSILRVDYGRAIQGTYHASFTLEDRTAIDDEGGQGSVQVIPLRNYYEITNNITSLFAGLIEWHSYFSRPIPLMRRSINMGLFFTLAPGDIVTVTDNFARSLITGRRGISAKPGMITQIRWSPPSEGRPMSGEVEIAFLSDVEDGKAGLLSPAGEVDSDYTSGSFTDGYSASTVTIRTLSNEHTDSAGSAVDMDSFAATDKIIVMEIDPEDPANPQYWERTIVSKTANTIELSSALTGYDGTKNYRVIAQKRSEVTAAQQSYAYQADANGFVESTTTPYIHGVGGSTSTTADVPTYATEAHEAVHERYAELAFGDGRPVDVGVERGLLRSVQNFHDHKAAIQSPVMEHEARTNPGDGVDSLHSISPIYLQASIPSTLTRYLYVAPYFRSTSGASVTLTVTLSDRPIPGGNAAALSLRGIRYNQVSFTTTSTTFAIPTALGLDLHVVPDGGEAFITITQTADSATYGLAECSMREYED